MASGKSIIGKYIAKKYDLPFIDLDIYTEKQEGRSVVDIFKEKGEIYFRKRESCYLKELINSNNSFVLSLGGGTPCYAGNLELIKNNKQTVSVYLRAKVSTLANRLVKQKGKRPLLANISNTSMVKFVSKHLFERSVYYNQATYTLNVDYKRVNVICKEIYTLINANKPQLLRN